MFLHGRRRIVSALALASALVAGLVWAANRESPEQQKINRLLADLRAAGVPLDPADFARLYPDTGHPDANIIFAKAFDLATNNPAPANLPMVTIKWNGKFTNDFTPAVRQQLETYLAATANITNALPQSLPPGTQFPMHWERGWTNGSAVNFVKVRALIYLLAADALAAVQNNDPERAALFLEAGFRVSSAIPFESGLVYHMIRDATEGVTSTVAEYALNHARFSESQLRRISDSIAPEGTNGLLASVQIEHAFAIATFTSARAGTPRQVLFGEPKQQWYRRAWDRITAPKPLYSDSDFVRYLELIPAQVHAVAEPPLEGVKEAIAVTTNYMGHVSSEIGEAVWYAAPTIITRDTEAQALVIGLRAAIAAERYRVAHGTPPNSLEALVPEFLPAVPRDPFGSGPLRFRSSVTRGDSPGGYVVYSIGGDGIDNGGVDRPSAFAQSNYDITIRIIGPVQRASPSSAAEPSRK